MCEWTTDGPCVKEYFPPEKIHSGESDFDPPRFKPDPSVYLLAAERASAIPRNCIAVEDSTSGVGSAANAGLGMIVGYVGASHIAEENKDGHAETLMAGRVAASSSSSSSSFPPPPPQNPPPPPQNPSLLRL